MNAAIVNYHMMRMLWMYWRIHPWAFANMNRLKPEYFDDLEDSDEDVDD